VHAAPSLRCTTGVQAHVASAPRQRLLRLFAQLQPFWRWRQHRRAGPGDRDNRVNCAHSRAVLGVSADRPASGRARRPPGAGARLCGHAHAQLYDLGPDDRHGRQVLRPGPRPAGRAALRARGARARTKPRAPSPPRGEGWGSEGEGLQHCLLQHCARIMQPCRTLNRLQPARCPASAKASVHAGAIGSQLVCQRKLVAPQSCTQTS